MANIMAIPTERCEVKFPQKGRGKRPVVKQGTVVGAYANAYWHRHMYYAYHIRFDDGVEDTLHWDRVKFLS